MPSTNEQSYPCRSWFLKPSKVDTDVVKASTSFSFMYLSILKRIMLSLQVNTIKSLNIGSMKEVPDNNFVKTYFLSLNIKDPKIVVKDNLVKFIPLPVYLRISFLVKVLSICGAVYLLTQPSDLHKVVILIGLILFCLYSMREEKNLYYQVEIDLISKSIKIWSHYSYKFGKKIQYVVLNDIKFINYKSSYFGGSRTRFVIVATMKNATEIELFSLHYKKDAEKTLAVLLSII